jgi:hypothetical protein
MLNEKFIKILAVGITSLVGLQMASFAESQRGIYTKENWFPGKSLWEFGARVDFIETDDAREQLRDSSVNSVMLEPYLRYGLTKDLSLDVNLPFGSSDSDASGTDSGLGNISIGLQLRAHEDVLEYPYVIPHVKLNLETADEDSGLDDGSGGVEIGVSVGTVVADMFNWVGDVSYEVRGDEENLVRGSVAVIADMSDRFALTLETSITDQGDSTGTDNPVILLGGMAYNWTHNVQSSWYGGGGLNTDNDVIAGFKTSYSF